MLHEVIVLTHFGRKTYPWKSLAHIAYHSQLLQQNNFDKTAKFILFCVFLSILKDQACVYLTFVDRLSSWFLPRYGRPRQLYEMSNGFLLLW